MRRTGLSQTRVAILPARGYRRAVDRNRDKRVVREWYRQMKHLLPSGYDLGIVLYPGSHSAAERRAQVAELLRRAGLLSGNEIVHG